MGRPGHAARPLMPRTVTARAREAPGVTHGLTPIGPQSAVPECPPRPRPRAIAAGEAAGRWVQSSEQSPLPATGSSRPRWTLPQPRGLSTERAAFPFARPVWQDDWSGVRV